MTKAFLQFWFPQEFYLPDVPVPLSRTLLRHMMVLGMFASSSSKPSLNASTWFERQARLPVFSLWVLSLQDMIRPSRLSLNRYMRSISAKLKNGSQMYSVYSSLHSNLSLTHYVSMQGGVRGVE